MKKLSYLILLALILGLVLTGCSLLSNVGQVPTTEQSGITYLTKALPLKDDLVGLWHFSGNAEDSSGKGNDGTVFGATYVDSPMGKALSFDGNDYVIVPDSLLLEPSEITVEAWVKRNGSPGSCKYIVSKYLPNRHGSYSSYGLYSGSNGGIRFYIGYTNSVIFSPATEPADIWDGEWHHVAGTFDGLEVKLYVDKMQVGGGTSTSQEIYYDGTGNLYIGAYTNISWLAFSGAIDEVRIWNVALTEGQLGFIYDFGGILPPFKPDGSSVFKLGRTIPVKFQLRDDQGDYVTDAVANIFVKKTKNGGIGEEIDVISTAAATSGNLFRYDFSSNQYIFNLSTKLPLNDGVSWSEGTWEIRIELDDGMSYYKEIVLKS